MPGRTPIKCVAAAAAVHLAVCCGAPAQVGPPHPADPAPSAAAEHNESLPLGSPRSGPKPSVRHDAPGASTMQTMLALGGVIALAVGAAAVLRRIARGKGGVLGALGPGGKAPSGLLEVLARYPVGRGSTLVLLKLDRRVLLVSQSPGRGAAAGGMSTLCEITDPEDVASVLLKTRDEDAASQARRFESILRGEDRTMARVMDEQPLAHGAVASVRTRLASLRGSGSVA